MKNFFIYPSKIQPTCWIQNRPAFLYRFVKRPERFLVHSA